MKGNNSIDKKVTELMAKMSLEEKVNQSMPQKPKRARTACPCLEST